MMLTYEPKVEHSVILTTFKTVYKEICGYHKKSTFFLFMYAILTKNLQFETMRHCLGAIRR